MVHPRNTGKGLPKERRESSTANQRNGVGFSHDSERNEKRTERDEIGTERGNGTEVEQVQERGEKYSTKPKTSKDTQAMEEPNQGRGMAFNEVKQVRKPVRQGQKQNTKEKRNGNEKPTKNNGLEGKNRKKNK